MFVPHPGNDTCSHDQSTLCKCGLVCKFWLWSSRSRLFSTIVLSSCGIHTALAVLCAPGSTILPHVRALEIEDCFNRFRLPWLDDVLPKLPQLSALEKLTLSQFEWDTLTPKAKAYLFSISRGLKSLILDYMTFTTLDQALQLISSAPSLEFLSLGVMYVRNEDIPLTKSNAPPIRDIVLGGCNYTSVIINWLCLSQPTPTVRKLTFDWVDAVQIPFVSAYIRKLGPHLEHLELGCTPVTYGGEPQGKPVDSIS